MPQLYLLNLRNKLTRWYRVAFTQLTKEEIPMNKIAIAEVENIEYADK